MEASFEPSHVPALPTRYRRSERVVGTKALYVSKWDDGSAKDGDIGIKRTIAVVSTSRADFGLLTPILHAIESSPFLDLQVYISGSHLSNDYGRTESEALASGFV